MELKLDPISLNASLAVILKGYIEINLDKDYEYNIEFVKGAARRYPDIIISYFSDATSAYLRRILIDHEDVDLDPRLFFNEDYQLLVILGIIDYRIMKFNESYRETLTICYNYVADHEKVILFSSLIKGMIDIYGYIEITELSDLAKSYLDPIEYKGQIADLKMFLLRGGLIFPFTKVIDNIVVRNEVLPVLDEFKKMRLSYYDKYYCFYTLSEYLAFGSSFTFNGISKLDYDNAFNQLLYKKYLSYYVSPTEAVDALGLEVTNPDDLDILYEFNVHYPKWLLKGHSIISFREKYVEGK